MYLYATIQDIDDQSFNSNTYSTATADTRRVVDYLRRVTKRVEKITGYRFVPETKTYYINERGLYDRRMFTQLELHDRPIVSIDSIVSGSTTVTSTEYRLYPYNTTPAFKIERLNDTYWTQELTDSDDRIAITGTFVYRQDYDRDGWVSSGDSVQDVGGINASVTTVTVTDADGSDENGLTRFSVGNVIRIDSEYMVILSIDTGANTLTVKRGELGTTAAAHDNATVIDVWSVEPDIVRACQLIVAYNINNTGNFTQATIDGTFITTSLEIPDEAKELLYEYSNWKVRRL